jgi:hypothetical protein
MQEGGGIRCSLIRAVKYRSSFLRADARKLRDLWCLRGTISCQRCVRELSLLTMGASRNMCMHACNMHAKLHMHFVHCMYVCLFLCIHIHAHTHRHTHTHRCELFGREIAYTLARYPYIFGYVCGHAYLHAHLHTRAHYEHGHAQVFVFAIPVMHIVFSQTLTWEKDGSFCKENEPETGCTCSEMYPVSALSCQSVHVCMCLHLCTLTDDDAHKKKT